MIKCTNCSSILNWNKSYCPICGGPVIDAPREAVPIDSKPAAPAPPLPDAVSQRDGADAKEPGIAEIMTGAESPSESVRVPDAAAPAAGGAERDDLLPPLEGASDLSGGGIVKGSGGGSGLASEGLLAGKVSDIQDSGTTIEHFDVPSIVAGSAGQGAENSPDGMFEKTAENTAMLISKKTDDGDTKEGSGGSAQGEFLKMFPSAKPD